MTGDDLTICFCQTEKRERPSAFENYWRAGSYTELLVFKRQREQEQKVKPRSEPSEQGGEKKLERLKRLRETQQGVLRELEEFLEGPPAEGKKEPEKQPSAAKPADQKVNRADVPKKEGPKEGPKTVLGMTTTLPMCIPRASEWARTRTSATS